MDATVEIVYVVLKESEVVIFLLLQHHPSLFLRNQALEKNEGLEALGGPGRPGISGRVYHLLIQAFDLGRLLLGFELELGE